MRKLSHFAELCWKSQQQFQAQIPTNIPVKYAQEGNCEVKEES